MATSPVEAGLNIREVLEQDPARIFTLSEMAAVNLLTIQLPRDRALVVRDDTDPKMLFKTKNVGWDATIDAPMHINELKQLEPLLRERRMRYTVQHNPPHTYKDQPYWLANLEIRANCLAVRAMLTLVEFGYSYGKVRVNNDVVVSISHSGGTTTDGGWVDYASTFHLVGDNRVAAMKSLILSREKV